METVFFFTAVTVSALCLILYWYNTRLVAKNNKYWSHIKELIQQRNEAREAYLRSKDDIAELLKVNKLEYRSWD
jgi:hypothetical protein